MPATTPDPSRLDALQALLYSRKSTFHLAHAAVSLLVAVAASCAAAISFWDYQFDGFLAFAIPCAIAVVLFIHGFVRWALGRRALRVELSLFAELVELRRVMGLDDPKALLPR